MRGQKCEDDVSESEGTPAVCLSCTREDCVKPAEMTVQTRPRMTRGTDDGLRKHPLKGVCCFSCGACVCVCVIMIHAE